MTFQKGQSGNPKGRPKGSKDKITEKFLKDFAEEWEKSGSKVLKQVAKDDPTQFAKLAASLVPKDYNVNTNDISEQTYEELRDELSRELASLQGEVIPDLATDAGAKRPH